MCKVALTIFQPLFILVIVGFDVTGLLLLRQGLKPINQIVMISGKSPNKFIIIIIISDVMGM